MTISLFDQWTIPDSTNAEGVAYHVMEGSEQSSAVWRLDLSEALGTAEIELMGYQDLIQASSEAIDLLPGELEDLVIRVEARTQGVAFAIADIPMTSAEADLLSMLEDVNRSDTLVSFTAGEQPLADWTAAYQQFRATTNRLLQAITSMVWVETRTGERLLGRTRVGWSGDTDTTYTHGISSDQASLHQRSLQIAVLSRNLLIRTISIAFAGAAKISALIATPGGALLALPVVWKYINQILEQVEQYQALNQPNVNKPV